MSHLEITTTGGWAQQIEIDGVDIAQHAVRAHLDLEANHLPTLEVEFLFSDTVTEVEGKVTYTASAWGEFASGESPVGVLRRLADAIEAKNGG